METVSQTLDSLKFSRTQPLRVQMADRLREMIRSGALAPGTRLPSTLQLAEQWGTRVETVHAALSRLTKEGLLDRSVKLGTFVRAPRQKLERVGIYMDHAVAGATASPFHRCLGNLLTGTMNRAKVKSELWADHRAECGSGQPWEDLVKAAQQRDIQGLIVTHFEHSDRDWLNDLPIPVVFLASRGSGNRVSLDYRPAYEQAMARLKQRGCDTVGMISVVTLARNGKAIGQSLHDPFFEAASAQGLRVEELWLPTPQENLSEGQTERFGYEAFTAMWSQPNRPRSLFVHTDVAARGFLLALMERQVRVPDDLHLVLHRNAEVGLLCPPPAMFIDVRVAEVAQALIEQLERSFHGEQLQPRAVTAHLVEEGRGI
jgi:DNA-binding LacI/PurR family transcriptional regulator/DNA-binding transcriptional regulator YhcF (GntR family)